MGSLSKALRHAVEAQEAEVRATISRLDPDGLVTWCRGFIDNSLAGWDDDVEAVVFHSLTQTDFEAALNLAKEHHRYHVAFKSVALDMRKRGQLLPKPWREYLLDLSLEITKAPDARGKTKVRKFARDHTICQCISLIVDHSDPHLKATRNSQKQGAPKVCAASIVADASRDNLSYDAVALIWKNRSKSFRP
jgi:hypothetical protein